MFKIGDIVSLKSHAYLKNLTDIIISGEQLLVPPLMIVSEILKIRKIGSPINEERPIPKYEYTCIWFSSKSHKFEKAKIKGIHLKLIIFAEDKIANSDLQEGSFVTLRSMDYELSKKKSSLSFEDNTLNNNSGNTTINALLFFLCPPLHVMSIQKHKNSLPLVDKSTGEQIRFISEYDVKCLWYNSNSEKFSEETLPIEVLTSISVVDQTKINLINKAIKSSNVLKIKMNEIEYLIKPRLIAYRSGYYFLRGFDYVLNRITENKINNSDIYEILETPFENIAPKFDVDRHPEAVSRKHMKQELKKAITVAKSKKAYIRIKYKNRNDQLSIRTLKTYRLANGKEDDEKVTYIIGFCMLRQAERTFNISMIQNYQELKLLYQ